MNEKRQQIAVLCTELTSIRTIAAACGRYFEILHASDAKSLRLIISSNPAPAAVVIDNGAAQISAIELLQSLRQSRPSIRRVLLTDYCDLGIIVEGLHTGAVEKIVYKPIHAPELLAAIGASTLPSIMIPPPLRSQPHRVVV